MNDGLYKKIESDFILDIGSNDRMRQKDVEIV